MNEKWTEKQKVPKISNKEALFIMVIWDDANEPDDGTHEIGYFDDDLTRHAPHVSVGIMLKDDKHGIVLCRDIQIHDELTQKELCIPRNYILAKRYLK